MILAQNAKLAPCYLAAVGKMYPAGWLWGGGQTIKRDSEFSVGFHPGAEGEGIGVCLGASSSLEKDRGSSSTPF